jgi:O-antigen/teichoic acid export membrane protein
MGFLTLQSFPWLILARHGTEQVAGFQAMFQFLAFSNPVLFSVGTLITATVARRGRYEFLSIRPYLTLVVGTIGGYLLLLILAAPAAMDLVLGKHSVYLPYAPLLRVLAFAWVFEGIALLSSAILGGLRSSRSLFQIQLAGAVVAIVAILPWIYFQGVFAAAVGMLVVNLVRAAAGVILIARQKANPQRLDHQFAATSGPAYEPIATREDSTNLTHWASR